METKSLNLIVPSREAVLAELAALSPEEQAQVSPEWLARVAASTTDARRWFDLAMGQMRANLAA